VVPALVMSFAGHVRHELSPRLGLPHTKKTRRDEESSLEAQTAEAGEGAPKTSDELVLGGDDEIQFWREERRELGE